MIRESVQYENLSIMSLIFKKESLKNLEKLASSSSKKINLEAQRHLNKIKSGKSTFLLGVLCPLLWWAILTNQTSPIIIMCLVHSLLYAIWGINSIKKGYNSLINTRKGYQ